MESLAFRRRIRADVLGAVPPLRYASFRAPAGAQSRLRSLGDRTVASTHSFDPSSGMFSASEMLMVIPLQHPASLWAHRAFFGKFQLYFRMMARYT